MNPEGVSASTRPVRVSTIVEPSGISGAPVAGFTIAREGPTTSSLATSPGSTRGAGGKGSAGATIGGKGWIAARGWLPSPRPSPDAGDFAAGLFSNRASSRRAASRCPGVASFAWISACSSRMRAAWSAGGGQASLRPSPAAEAGAAAPKASSSAATSAASRPS
jgi:hypothetical protein